MANNEELKHSKGGPHTRDKTGVGVPMDQGDGSEPVGPEDALDPTTPKREDYSGRVGDTRHVQTEAIYKGRYDIAPEIVTTEQNLVPDPGAPLDAADPNYERLLAQRTKQARKEGST